MSEEMLREALRPGPDCMSVEVLLESMDQPQGAPARLMAERHVAECPRCSGELALANEFVYGQPRPEEIEAVEWIAARTSRNSGSRPKPWWTRVWTTTGGKTGLVAIAAAAAALVIAVNVHTKPALPEIGGNQEIFRSAPLHAVSPIGESRTTPDVFEWTKVEAAAAYVLTIEEVDHTPVFQGTVDGTSAPVPMQARKILQAGRPLLWSVIARDAKGAEVASSGAQRVIVSGAR